MSSSSRERSDSSVKTRFPLSVRPVTLSDLLREIDHAVESALDAADMD